MAAFSHRLLAPVLLGAALLLTASAPAGALAQEEGVTLDPGDPAAKEYSLPHAEARREASGSAGAPTQQGSADAELFGEGVSKDGEAKASGDGSSASGAADGTDASANPDASATTASAPAPGDDEVEAGGFSSTTVLLGGAALALLAAAGGGFTLRALRGPDQ